MRNPITRIYRQINIRTRALRQGAFRRLMVGPPQAPGHAVAPIELNRTQELFCRWNADRLGISLQESKQRYFYSWRVLTGGHQGLRYSSLMYMQQEVFSVFFGNRPEELFDTYRFLGHRDLLRWISKPEAIWPTEHPIVPELCELDEVKILDYGCGLARHSRALAELLLSRGRKVHLYLVDIPTVAGEFLTWLGENSDLSLTFIPCTRETPIPDLPEFNVCFAMEFFEHVADPILFFDRFDRSMLPGGFLLGDIGDHEEGFLHISADLSKLRQEVRNRAYEEVRRNHIYRKPR